jgi:nitrogenase subunit NifH
VTGGNTCTESGSPTPGATCNGSGTTTITGS